MHQQLQDNKLITLQKLIDFIQVNRRDLAYIDYSLDDIKNELISSINERSLFVVRDRNNNILGILAGEKDGKEFKILNILVHCEIRKHSKWIEIPKLLFVLFYINYPDYNLTAYRRNKFKIYDSIKIYERFIESRKSRSTVSV